MREMEVNKKFIFALGPSAVMFADKLFYTVRRPAAKIPGQSGSDRWQFLEN